MKQCEVLHFTENSPKSVQYVQNHSERQNFLQMSCNTSTVIFKLPFSTLILSIYTQRKEYYLLGTKIFQVTLNNDQFFAFQQNHFPQIPSNKITNLIFRSCLDFKLHISILTQEKQLKINHYYITSKIKEKKSSQLLQVYRMQQKFRDSSDSFHIFPRKPQIPFCSMNLNRHT